MHLEQVLALPLLKDAEVVAGGQGLMRLITSASVIDHPYPEQWAQPNQVLVTTGYAWPKSKADLTTLVHRLNAVPVAGVLVSVPHFIDEIPGIMRETANEVSLPLVEIPWELPMSRVTEAITRSLLSDSHAELERLSEFQVRMTKAALEEDGLRHVVGSLRSLLGAEVFIEDGEGRIIISAREDDADAIASGSDPRRGGRGMMRVLAENGYIDPETFAATIRLNANSEIGLPACILSPVRHNTRLLGCLSVVLGEGKTTTSIGLRAIEASSIVAAICMSRRESLLFKKTRLESYFFDELLDGRVRQESMHTGRARAMGFDVDRKYRIGVVLLNEQPPLTTSALEKREEVANRLRSNMAASGFKPLIALRPGKLVALLPEGLDPDALTHGVPAGSGTLLVGGLHTGIEGVRRSYDEAMTVSRYARAGEVNHYDDWIVPRIVLGDDRARRLLVDRTFGELRKRKGGDALCKTLVGLVETDFNITATATSLGVHRNTLYYRIGQIQDALGLDLENLRERFELQLAVYVMGLESDWG